MRTSAPSATARVGTSHFLLPLSAILGGACARSLPPESQNCNRPFRSLPTERPKELAPGAPTYVPTDLQAYLKEMRYSRNGMPVVFVIATEWKLRAAVRAELRELGVDALGMDSAEDVGRALAGGAMPAVVVMEANAELAGDPAIQGLVGRVPTALVAS